MPKFGPVSITRLSECHPDLQALFYAVIAKTDCTVLCGHRGDKEQQEAYLAGTSKAQAGQSPHNKTPSMAVDAAPYPIDWKNIQRFQDFGSLVKATAAELGIAITWGGDFKSFKDYPHFELTNWKGT